MSSLKKHKQAKLDRARELRMARIDSEGAFDAAIQKAAGITDPAEKILALRQVSNDITAQINKEKNAIDQKVSNTDNDVGAATALASLAVVGTVGGLVMSAVIPPLAVIGLPAVVVGIGVSRRLSSKHAASVGKNLEEASKDHMENMQDLKALVSVMTDVTIENNVKEISQSLLNPQIRTLPGIKDKFAEAMVKHIAETDVTAEAPELSAPQSRKKPDFRSITRALGSK